MRRDITQTFLNACDLYVESIKVQTLGYFYFAWKRGRKMAQSLKYQSNGATTFVKETLTLNIKTVLKNGRVLQKNTALYLLNAEGLEIDQVSLPIHKWRTNFNTIEVPIAGGLMVAKVCLKQLMQVQNCVHTNSDISDQESSQVQSAKIMPWSRKNTNFIDGYKDQMQRVRKELEDKMYYNNKLKNDRNVLMSRNLELQSQLNALKKQIKDEWHRMEKNFKKKIQIRQQIYEQEINSMVLAFNSNYQMNNNIMETLFVDLQKEKAQLTTLKVSYDAQKAQNQKDKAELTQRMSELEVEKEQLQRKLDQYLMFKEKYEELQLSYEEVVKKLTETEEELAQQKQKSHHLQFEVTQNNFELEQLRIENNELKEKIQMLQNFIAEEGDKSRQNSEALNFRIREMQEQIKILINDLEANKNQLEFTEEGWNKDKQQKQKIQEEYRNHIKMLEEQLNKFTQSESQTEIKATNNLNQELALLRQQNKTLQQKSVSARTIKSESERDNVIGELQQRLAQTLQENQKLKEQLQMKLSNYEALSERIQEMEKGIDEVNKSPMGLLFPGKKADSSLSESRMSEEVKSKLDEQQKIIQELQESIQKLHVEKEEERAQREQIQEKYDLLTIQFAQKIAKIKKKKLDNKKYNVEEIQYCESQDEENQQLMEEMQKQLNLTLKEKPQQKRQDERQPQSMKQISEIDPKENKEKIEPFKFFPFPPIPSRKQSLEKEVVSQKEEVKKIQSSIDAAVGIKLSRKNSMQSKRSSKEPSSEKEEKIIQMQKVDEPKKQNKPNFFGALVSIPYQNHDLEQEKEAVLAGGDSAKNSQNSQNSKNSQSSKKSKEQKEKQRQLQKKLSRKSIGERSQHSDRQSFASGGTYYRYKRVSHKEKIKGLEGEIVDLKQQLQLSHQKQKNLSQKIENNLKIIRELRENLAKAEKEFEDYKIASEIEKQKNKKQLVSHGVQAKAERQSKGSEADIDDPKLIKQINQQINQIQQHKKSYEKLTFEFKTAKTQSESEIKILISKVSDSDKKISELTATLIQLRKEHQKLKRQSQQKQRQAKDNYQDIKLQKAQVQFELGNFQSDSKRLKNRIQELQEKVRKTDVIDALRQAQFQSQTANKKIVEMNRTLYQLRLEKQNVEDQMKLIRKKYNDQQKRIIDAQDQVDKLEKGTDELKRKQSRYKRDIQDKEDTIDKLRDQIKRLNDQIATIKSYNTQQAFERKKIMDDLSNLQHMTERKDYEMVNLRKEIEKYKQKLQQKEQERMDKKNSLKKQIQTLQDELLKRDKEIIQLESQIKHLTNRLEVLQQENKKNINSTSQSYSEKLKLYIDEITQIKKLLEDNNAQIASLRQKINELYEQNEYLKSNYNKLQLKYDDEIANSEDIYRTLTSLKQQNDTLRDKYLKLQHENEGHKNSIKILKTQQENNKKEFQLKNNKIQQLLNQHDNNTQLINRYKVKLSDFETESSISKKLAQKLKQAQSKIQQLSLQLKGATKKYDEYSRTYTITNDHYEQTVKDTQTKWKQEMERKIAQLANQMQNQTNMKVKKLQGDLIDLLNENSRLRTDIQKRAQHMSEMDHKQAKLQTLPLRIQELENLLYQRQQECNRYRQYEQKALTSQEKVAKLQAQLNQLVQANRGINEETNHYKKDKKDLQIEIHNLFLKNREAEHNLTLVSRQLQDGQKMQMQLKGQISNLIGKVKTLEGEKEYHQKKLIDSKKQYDIKITSLQEKLQQMGTTMNQHQKILQTHYQNVVQEHKTQLNQCYDDIEGKQKQIGQYLDIINKLQMEISDLKNEVQTLIEKNEADADLYEMQMNSMRNRLAENERVYISNISNLQNELAQMSKEMTTLKMHRASTARKLKMSQIQQENPNEKRLEDKIRQRDHKIEEMKNNIYIFQETLAKLKKKDQKSTHELQQLHTLRRTNTQLSQEIKNLTLELDKTKAKLQQLSHSMKSQVNLRKQRQDELGLGIQQKLLQLESVKYELGTLKGLYSELQNELEKRKNTFKQKLDAETVFNSQLQSKNEKIAQLQIRIEEYEDQLGVKDTELKKKLQQINLLQTDKQGLSKLESKFKSTFNEKLNNQNMHKAQINRMIDEQERLKLQNRKMKDSNFKLQKELAQVKRILSLNQNSIDSLNSTNEELTTKYKDAESVIRKYHDLNERAYHHYQMSLDELFYQNYFGQKLQKKEEEINSLIEEVQELKFMNERKFMDYDELKRQNYQLQLKAEDGMFASEQVDELRSICDKLEQEKKDALWRQQMMRNQLNNFMSLEDEDYRMFQESLKRRF